MGNGSSRTADHNVFKNELAMLNAIVNNILNEDDVFKNNDYNFLSQDVCDKYQVILEDELQKHLKVTVKELGTSLYIIPKDADSTDKLTKMNLTKKQVCERVSNHYIKILYVLSLIKYVYNIERDGDLSIAGIVFRNIRILDDVMEINFCDLPHRNYGLKNSTETYKLNFSKLEGFKFFVDYFLDRTEASAFVSIMRSILARNSKQKFTSLVCHHVENNSLKPDDIKTLEAMYLKRYGSRLVCNKKAQVLEPKTPSRQAINLDIFVNKENPILAKEHCFAPRKVIIKTSTHEGKQVMQLYEHMKKNYTDNVNSVVKLLDHIVSYTRNGEYELKDIDKHVLDSVIDQVKSQVKAFYIQSIVDFQNLLDKARLIPNIEGS